jgi:hypothetical protein
MEAMSGPDGSKIFAWWTGQGLEMIRREWAGMEELWIEEGINHNPRSMTHGPRAMEQS